MWLWFLAGGRHLYISTGRQRLCLRLYLPPWACHLALSQQREAYAKQFPVVTICLFLLFARSPGHPVDEIHVHGRFLAEEGDLMVDVDVYAVPALVSKRYSA